MSLFSRLISDRLTINILCFNVGLGYEKEASYSHSRSFGFNCRFSVGNFWATRVYA